MLDTRKRKRFDAVVWCVSIAFALLLPWTADAEGKRYANANPVYQAECGSCHVAYPPALMSAEGWNTIMNSLDRHFGTDASLDEAKRRELAAYLGAAGGSRAVSTATRISDASWFRREHRRIASATWKSAAVKSPANCEACHRDAATGDFSEHNVQVPREVSK